MRELTGHAEPIDDSVVPMRLHWFKFRMGNLKVSVDTVGSGSDNSTTLTAAAMELHLTLSRNGKAIAVEKLDMIDFAILWARSITKDR